MNTANLRRKQDILNVQSVHQENIKTPQGCQNAKSVTQENLMLKQDEPVKPAANFVLQGELHHSMEAHSAIIVPLDSTRTNGENQTVWIVQWAEQKLAISVHSVASAHLENFRTRKEPQSATHAQ